MKTFWQGLLAAAVGGASASSAQVLSTGGSWKQTGISAAMGALVTVLAYLSKSPLQPVPEPTPEPVKPAEPTSK